MAVVYIEGKESDYKYGKYTVEATGSLQNAQQFASIYL